MAILTGSWIIDSSLLASALIIGIYAFYEHQFRYWKKRNVVFAPPSFPFGNTTGVNFSISVGTKFKNLYDQFKGHRFFGAWIAFSPTIVIRDPELAKHIFVKDFMHFHDRGIYSNQKDDPLTGHLFLITGIKWRNLRTKLTPTFTSGKMKMMFPVLEECSEELKDLLKDPASKGEVVEMKEICARFTTDIISLSAFGIRTNSLKNPEAEFRKMGRKFFEPCMPMSLRRFTLFFIPTLAKFLELTFIPRDVSKFFLGALKETMDYREKNNITRNDFLQLLIQLKNKGKIDDADEGIEVEKSINIREQTDFSIEQFGTKEEQMIYAKKTWLRTWFDQKTRLSCTVKKFIHLPLAQLFPGFGMDDNFCGTIRNKQKNYLCMYKKSDMIQLNTVMLTGPKVFMLYLFSDDIKKFTFVEAAAQAFVFFAAGFETSSTTMQFALYELSLNQEIQEKTRQEIFQVLVKHDGKLTYDSIFEMDYLGRVIDETLRKYPPNPVLQRECTKDYVIPDTEVVIPAGMQVQIPIFGIQMDPEHYPNPEKFDPERFTEEEKSKRHHYSYLPFGEGPRNCIGMRFGVMQTRVGLATLLSNYKFEICRETQIPLVMEPKSFFLAPQKMMNLKITTVNK